MYYAKPGSTCSYLHMCKECVGREKCICIKGSICLCEICVCMYMCVLLLRFNDYLFRLERWISFHYAIIPKPSIIYIHMVCATCNALTKSVNLIFILQYIKLLSWNISGDSANWLTTYDNDTTITLLAGKIYSKIIQ